MGYGVRLCRVIMVSCVIVRRTGLGHTTDIVCCVKGCRCQRRQPDPRIHW